MLHISTHIQESKRGKDAPRNETEIGDGNVVTDEVRLGSKHCLENTKDSDHFSLITSNGRRDLFGVEPDFDRSQSAS